MVLHKKYTKEMIGWTGALFSLAAYAFKQFKYNRESVKGIPGDEYIEMYIPHHLCFLQKSLCKLGAQFYLAFDNSNSFDKYLLVVNGEHHLSGLFFSEDSLIMR